MVVLVGGSRAFACIGAHARQLLWLSDGHWGTHGGCPAAPADRRGERRLRDGGVERPRRAPRIGPGVDPGFARVAAPRWWLALNGVPARGRVSKPIACELGRGRGRNRAREDR